MAPVSVLTGFDCSSIEHYALVNDLYLWVSVYTLHSTGTLKSDHAFQHHSSVPKDG